tara:strand:+ start:199 stop:957 length:759 start_codon:yes stop_codon:yes gene_type:complete
MKNKMKIGIGLLLLVLVLPMINADMYSILQSLEAKNCDYQTNLMMPPSMNPIIDKFGLGYGGGDNCTFIMYTEPYSESIKEFIWFPTGYAELDYIVDGGVEYLFILGQDYSAYTDITNIIMNYEDYQYYLINDNRFNLIEGAYYDPDYTGPSNDGCVDQAGATLYTGNSGTYQDDGTINFNSSCYDSESLMYPFCMENTFINFLYNCDCVNGKCIASSSSIFNLIGFYGLTIEYQKIDDEMLNSAVSSWINN